MALNVVCCLWGNWPEPGWESRYVAALKNGVSRHLSKPHRFVCFADDLSKVPEGIEAKKLDAPSWKGCLPKLSVYNPDLDLEGRVILLDLDNVITGPLDRMAEYDGDLAVRAKFGGYPRRKIADGDMIGFEAKSPKTKKLWNEFVSNPGDVEKWTGGRERYYLREHNPDLWQDLLGHKYILSYKNHLENKRAPGPETSIVSFHDRNNSSEVKRPHTINAQWLKEAWRA